METYGIVREKEGRKNRCKGEGEGEERRWRQRVYEKEGRKKHMQR